MTIKTVFVLQKVEGTLSLSQKRYKYQQTKGQNYLVDEFSKFLANFKTGEIVRTKYSELNRNRFR